MGDRACGDHNQCHYSLGWSSASQDVFDNVVSDVSLFPFKEVIAAWEKRIQLLGGVAGKFPSFFFLNFHFCFVFHFFTFHFILIWCFPLFKPSPFLLSHPFIQEIFHPPLEGTMFQSQKEEKTCCTMSQCVTNMHDFW